MHQVQILALSFIKNDEVCKTFSYELLELSREIIQKVSEQSHVTCQVYPPLILQLELGHRKRPYIAQKVRLGLRLLARQSALPLAPVPKLAPREVHLAGLRQG